jgi:hypothetical protein
MERRKSYLIAADGSLAGMAVTGVWDPVERFRVLTKVCYRHVCSNIDRIFRNAAQLYCELDQSSSCGTGEWWAPEGSLHDKCREVNLRDLLVAILRADYGLYAL